MKIYNFQSLQVSHQVDKHYTGHPRPVREQKREEKGHLQRPQVTAARQ